MAKTLPVVLVAVLAVPLATPIARADDLWGCEVTLCMANPDGPTAAPACRDHMDRLSKQLRRGRPVPRCPQASVAPAQIPVGSGEMQQAADG